MNKFLKQEEILAFMRDGWELGFSRGFNSYYWLQKGGLCKGGETKKVRSDTVRSMLIKGSIEIAPKRKGDQFWLERHRIKERT